MKAYEKECNLMQKYDYQKTYIANVLVVTVLLNWKGLHGLGIEGHIFIFLSLQQNNFN